MERILIIDDELASVAAVKMELRKKLPDVHIVERDFSGGLEAVGELLPHIVILDLIKGDPVDGEEIGLGFYQQIWRKKCCPTIIHSARADDFADDFEDHPLVKVVRKGSGAEARVLEAVDEFKEVLESLKAVEGRLHYALSRFLVRGLDQVKRHAQGSSEILEYCALRHVAASIDDPDVVARSLKPWECYLIPAAGTSVQLGDLLRKTTSDKADPSSYVVVLTPSCDLVNDHGRQPKVLKLLACQCGAISSRSFQTKAKNVSSYLSQGFYKHLLPLPAFPDEWPNMAGDFRSLLTIPVDQVSCDTDDPAAYTRVASLDSPFRELVSWAFVQHNGRPGLPDRDYKSWAQGIVDESI